MFANLVQSMAAAEGVPSLPSAVIEHPLGGLAPEEVRAKADKAINRIIQLMTEPAGKLASGRKAPAK